MFLEDGEGVSYDKLLIATGSRGYLPPVKGLDNAENVCAFHTLGDCEIVLKKACTARNIVILGAGLVGLMRRMDCCI